LNFNIFEILHNLTPKEVSIDYLFGVI
jgi:hypothetical protein